MPTERGGNMMGNRAAAPRQPGRAGFGQVPGEHAPNYGKKYPPEVLTSDEVGGRRGWLVRTASGDTQYRWCPKG